MNNQMLYSLYPSTGQLHALIQRPGLKVLASVHGRSLFNSSGIFALSLETLAETCYQYAWDNELDGIDVVWKFNQSTAEFIKLLKVSQYF